MEETSLRIAIVHEWFTGMRGGEKCVEALCEMFPGAGVFALLHVPGSVSPVIERAGIHTTFVQHLPRAAQAYRYYLPLFPTAVRQFDLSGFDVVISSHHCVAKSVRTKPGTLHLCYCYTPMRYLWDKYDDYFSRERAGVLTRIGMRVFRGYLRRSDLRTASHPHHFIAISRNVQGRIANIYRRDADIIYPPVDVDRFSPSENDGGYYLVVSAFVPYKRVDLAIAACAASGDPLVVVGDGPELARLKAIAAPNIRFVGWVSDEQLREYYAGCSALLFPGEEDFGIVPVEALSAGKPVIAYGKGGALETIDDSTGVFFDTQSVDSLLGAMARFREKKFSPATLHQSALRFTRKKFQDEMRRYIERRWLEFRNSPKTI
jgi:glycosyltransferase involved in cell wall biosynthesis